MNNTACPPDCACGCCAGTERRTPLSIANPPGLAALSYRVGAYGDFLSSMLARLSTMEVPAPDPAAAASSLARILAGRTTPTAQTLPTPLAALTTRSPDDPAIALLDAWAVVLDVLTFYQERIANEGFLRTATESFSVRELARLVGYTPSPGVGSSAFLAYTLEQGGPVTIPAGSRASSTPGPKETPQSFETSDDLDADPRWNAPAPRRMRPQAFQPGQTTAGKRVFFQGLTTQLQPNDPLVLVFDAAQGEPFRVKKVTPDNPNQRTTVVLQDFATTPVVVTDQDAASAAAAIRAAVDAYHAAEPVQIEATIRIATTVSDGLAKLTHLPDAATPAEITQDLTDASNLVKSQRDLATNLKQDNYPLDQLIGALGQLGRDLQALNGTMTPAHVRDRSGAALTHFNGNLGLGPDYPSTAIAVEQTVNKLLSKLDGLGTAPDVQSVLFELRADLIQLRATGQSIPPGQFPPLAKRLEGLIARLETAEDGLLLQYVAGAMTNYTPPPTSSTALAARFADLKKAWSKDAIKDLSPVEVANSIVGTITTLDGLFDLDAASVQKFHDDAARYLYSAISAILRQILNRFYYEQQAGVSRDTQLRDEVEEDFDALRDTLNPSRTLDQAVSDLIAQIASLVQSLAQAQAPVLAVTPGPEPLTDLQNALQSSLNEYKATQDLNKFTTGASSAIQKFRTDRDAYSRLLDDVTNALTAYVNATSPPSGNVPAAPPAHGRAPLADLRQAVEGIKSQAGQLVWLNQRLQDLLDATNDPNDPDTRINDFNAGFGATVPVLKDAFATVSNLALSLAAFLPSESGVGGLLAQAQALLLDLRRAQYVARAGQYPRVGPWLDEVVEALEQFSSDLTQNVAPSGDDAGAELQREQSAGASGRLALDNLPDIQEVGKPASSPPASAYRLQRQLGLTAGDTTDDPAAAFLDDLAPQLASALNPSLGDKLYTALANTVTCRTRRFQGVYALRARSAPFGHNAPQRTILYPDGTVAATREWLLAFERATVRVAPLVGLDTPFASATVEVQFETQDGSKVAVWSNPTGTDSGVTTGATDIHITVGGLQVDVTLPGTKLTKLSLSVHVSANARSVTVTQTVACSPDVSLQCNDQKKAVRLGDDGGYLSVGNNLQGNLTLNVLSEVRAALPPANRNRLRLEATNDKVVPGGYVVIQRATGKPQLLVARIEAVNTVSPKDFGLSGTVTQLTLDRAWLQDTDTSLGNLRDVTVYVQSEELPLAGEPYDADLGGSQLELDDVVPGLKPGRWLIVSGERTDLPGVTGVQAAELAMLAAATQVVDAAGGDGQGNPHTLLRLAVPLAYSYQRATATIYANVVKATQGETRSEILGAGNPAVPDQTFTLKQGPLTFLPAPVPSGVAATLQVRVNGVLWHPTDDPLGAGPNDRVYVLSLTEGAASVVFGDGTHGARPASGADNVRALYRVGLGQSGNVAAGKINQLATRPLGVKAVVNPLAASGGADPEGPDSARRNAPLGATALGRLVSVSDYADFARGFVGIEKAYAARISDGFVTRLHLTLAGQNGDAIDPNSDLYRNLNAALRRYGDPGLPFTVAARRLRFIVLVARLRIDPDYQFEDVVPRVSELLWDAYGFDRRDFAQDVVLSEAVALVQSVAGVLAVRVDGFGLVDQGGSTGDGADGGTGAGAPPPASLDQLAGQIAAIASATPVPAVLTVFPTRRGATGILPAEIALLSRRVPQTLILNEWTP